MLMARPFDRPARVRRPQAVAAAPAACAGYPSASAASRAGGEATRGRVQAGLPDICTTAEYEEQARGARGRAEAGVMMESRVVRRCTAPCVPAHWRGRAVEVVLMRGFVRSHLHSVGPLALGGRQPHEHFWKSSASGYGDRFVLCLFFQSASGRRSRPPFEHTSSGISSDAQGATQIPTPSRFGAISDATQKARAAPPLPR